MHPAFHWLRGLFLSILLNLGKLDTIVVDTNEHAVTLLSECKQQAISLRLIVIMDPLEKQTATTATKRDVIVRWMGEIEEFGRHSLKEFVVKL